MYNEIEKAIKRPEKYEIRAEFERQLLTNLGSLITSQNMI